MNPTWIMNLLQAEKLERDTARALLVQCVGASRHVRELDLHEAELEKVAVQNAAHGGSSHAFQSLEAAEDCSRSGRLC